MRRFTPRLLLSSLACLLGTVAGPAPTPAVPPDGVSSWLDLAPPPDLGDQLAADAEILVYLQAARPGEPEALWSVAGAEPRRLWTARAPDERLAAFAVSPDGRWVAFTVAIAGGPRLLSWVDRSGGTPQAVPGPTDGLAFGDVEHFAFRADSRELAYRGGANVGSVVVLGFELFADGFETGDSAAWSDTTPNPCPTPTGGPTLHANSILSNEVWTANGSPHVLTSNVLIPAGVTVTVAPCAEVRVRPGFDLTVQGTLIAAGTPLQRIRFQRDVAASPWDSIWVRSPGFARLAFVDLSGGGAAGASVLVEGVDSLPPALPLLADHLKVVGSSSYGVRLFRHAGFSAASRNLVVVGSGATDPTAPFPVRMSLNTVGTLPVGSYVGNASDLIQVIGEGDSAVVIDDAFHDRGVPYQIGGPAGAFGLIVVDGDPSLATLTIDPGVEIRFYSAGSNIGGLFVGTSGSPVATGRIVADGTAAEPILFTAAGAAPPPGSWEGVTFFGALAPGNVLDHVRIDAAGDNGGDANFGCPPAAFPETSGALKIFAQPASSFLTNSTISRSSTHGVFRAWTGAQVDFMASNTFDDVAFCHQVLPRPPLPALCPPEPECPQ